ncbi:enoyl-CoA hydratase/isomerase family protein [Parvularcula sp. ZS-1/3]|uniref:3-hydroxyisobutyryl-CoA hydrolase n=1 Tax=Parvularcula mediterranea TaxID=2732508 RepID=A0A7Y3W6T3_9PROT|nr:enoyl-CoA hydratase/isomerase family protein [Parvularcula mediterranea]NNU17692.1 enoyl-CoA hydratase/isomerase family protein [Parvularcula mediterranea]
MTNDVLFETRGGWGVITLSRPKALNALTADMCTAMDSQLRSWADDDAVKAILIEGEGEKAFCAGGDIRWLAETAKENPVEAATFFRTEYRLNNFIAHYKKPYIALIDGICMGGGVGVSAMADRRVVTERTLWAMPECGIGLMPDVGASHFLRQLNGGLGLYLALTGARLRGSDCVTTGIGTHMVPSEKISDLRDALLSADLSGDILAAVDGALQGVSSPEPGPIAGSLRDIDKHFLKVDSFDQLFSSLKDAGAFGDACLDAMKPGSPTSQALTFRLLNDAPEGFSACISREFCVAAHLMEGPDFLEGVRAQIIDKDRNPKWQPASLEEVTDEMVDRYFTEPEGGPLELD